jgi:hypothetical protein
LSLQDRLLNYPIAEKLRLLSVRREIGNGPMFGLSKKAVCQRSRVHVPTSFKIDADVTPVSNGDECPVG